MATRTTHEIETPVGKHKVVINDWMTGGEKRKLSGLKDDNERGVSLIGSLVVSIDGKAEGVMETMDNMHGKDFDFILNDLGEVAANSSISIEKKTS
jgi:hypothetical protein